MQLCRARKLLLAGALITGGLVMAAGASSGWFASFGGRNSGARLSRLQRSPRFVNGKFQNPVPTNKLLPGSFWEMVRHQLFGKEQRVPPGPLPVVMHTAADYATPPASGLRATWIGHASTLIEIDGARVLTDPIWSERCSPSTLVGPKRFHPPPIPLDELPRIDAVVISHDHYDHLDMATIRALASQGARFAVPLGVGAHLERWGVAEGQIAELDWEESVEIAGLAITAAPARHYSGRTPLRGDETLWASWVIAGRSHRVYFSGDTGYFDGFKAIGQRHGPFDLTLIKIGACDKTWPDIHLSPEEAVQAHLDLGGRLLLPVHWGTFNLAFHAWNDPADRVAAAGEKAGAALVVPRPGEWVEPSRPPALEAWWRKP